MRPHPRSAISPTDADPSAIASTRSRRGSSGLGARRNGDPAAAGCGLASKESRDRIAMFVRVQAAMRIGRIAASRSQGASGGGSWTHRARATGSGPAAM